MFLEGNGGICNAGEERQKITERGSLPSVLTFNFHSPYSLLYYDGSFFQQIFIKALLWTEHYTNTLHLGSSEKINIQSTILIGVIS